MADFAPAGDFLKGLPNKTLYKGKLVSKRTPNPNFLRADAQVFTEAGQPVLTISTVLGR